MESIFVIIGSLIAIFCTVLIFNEKKKIEDSFYDKENLIKEQENLTKVINEIVAEFSITATHTAETLDSKLKEIEELKFSSTVNSDLEELKKELDIIKNQLNNHITAGNTKKRTTKEKIIKLVPQTNENHLELQDTVPSSRGTKKNEMNGFETEIDEFLKKGMSEKEISEKTGKSLGEIEFILGLKNMR